MLSFLYNITCKGPECFVYCSDESSCVDVVILCSGYGTIYCTNMSSCENTKIITEYVIRNIHVFITIFCNHFYAYEDFLG